MKQKLIFFVDDDKMMINLMEYTFRNREGYEVQSFYSGEDCLANLNHNPDIVVLDHLFDIKGKAGMSGLETLKEIKKRNPRIKVIILSKQEEEQVITDYLNNGACQYISKDAFFIDSLMDAIDHECTSQN
jgi:two-component system, OmpR family, response regulator